MTITLPLSLQVSSLPDDACTFWNAALVSLVITFTVGPQHSLILLFSTVSFRVLQHLFASLLYSFFFVLSFWRGTNPFATVKLKPTATDDRSSPRFHRQWHLNPETNAFENSGVVDEVDLWWRLFCLLLSLCTQIWRKRAKLFDKYCICSLFRD